MLFYSGPWPKCLKATVSRAERKGKRIRGRERMGKKSEAAPTGLVTGKHWLKHCNLYTQ